MEIPPELKLLKPDFKGEVLRLKQVLYGRRSAPASFRDHLEQILLMSPHHNLQRGTIEPCLFYCATTHLRVSHHVDDLRLTGPTDAIDSMIKHMASYLLLKCGPKLRPGTAHFYLGRRRIRIPDGFIIQPDSKHLQNVLTHLGITDRYSMKEVSTPGVQRPWSRDEDEVLPDPDAQ
eukprot:3002672-Amphidinium_carterae.1